ncbi:MAG: rod shape-determining protein MreD [Treponema sp.]|jgi:rod shape-determining protein MreD|nr:rod shape-determining protein MreD [Treponema sp.]
MIKKVVWGVIFILIAVLLQSTVLSRLVIYIYAVPDLALCILVFIAYVNGTMTGQFTGFISGFLLDFLSAAPLGLNAFVRTLVGALTGLFKDTFYLDFLFFPMLLCAGATVFKVLVFFLLHLIFPDSVPSYDPLTLTLWIELAMNTFSAPFLFALLKLIRPLNARQKEAVL